ETHVSARTAMLQLSNWNLTLAVAVPKNIFLASVILITIAFSRADEAESKTSGECRPRASRARRRPGIAAHRPRRGGVQNARRTLSRRPHPPRALIRGGAIRGRRGGSRNLARCDKRNS